jgi:hypothetical protein
MPGWTVVPGNRALNSNYYLIASEGTIDTSYPLANLNDWHHWNQTRIAAQSVAGTYTVTIKCVNTNLTLSNDWNVGGIGLVNHNADGLTLNVKSKQADTNDATNNYGTATARASFAPLDSQAAMANMLYSLSDIQAQAWYFKFTSGSAFTLRLGNVVIGSAFDLGYPMLGEGVGFQYAGGIKTETGLDINSRIIDPTVVKNITFADPTYLTKTLTYDRTGISATGVTYNTFFRHFAYARHLAHGAANASYPTYTTIGAGAGIPCLYHEGTNNGLSSAGRPAFYGVWSPSIVRNEYRTISKFNVQIVDAIPRGSDFVPTTY